MELELELLITNLLTLTHPHPSGRHEVNCLTKEEFERQSRSPSLARQGSQIQSPLSSSTSVNDVIKNPEVGKGAATDAPGEPGATQANGSSQDGGRDHKALALVVQPSIDYGKLLPLNQLSGSGSREPPDCERDCDCQ